MRNLGKIGERLVGEKYSGLGFKLLERNFIFPHGVQMGELDLIFIKAQELVFVEVKTRKNEKFGSAFESVDGYKQHKLIKMVKLYLQLNPKYQNYNYRIDVAAVDIDNPINPVIILENAIEDLD